MADTKITGLTELNAAPATDDLLVIVDTSDTTMAGTGTDKKITVQNLVSGVGMAELFDSTLGGAQASFDATGLSGSYRDLLIEVSLTPASGGNGDVHVQFNGDTGSNYEWVTGYTTGSIGGANASSSDTKIKVDTHDTTNRYLMRLNVRDYADTGIHKYVLGQAFRIGGAAFTVGARWKSNSAITQVTISLSSGNLQSGSRCRIYGIAAQ